jgi:ABC-type multidrug transport system permease subunit
VREQQVDPKEVSETQTGEGQTSAERTGEGRAGDARAASASSFNPSHEVPSSSPQERLRPLVELTLVRFREFLREPEAVFWTFVFPVLLAFALGIAFRNQPPAQTRVAVIDSSPRAADVAGALVTSGAIEVEVLPEDQAATALRKGRVDLVLSLSPSAALGPSRVDGLAGATFDYRYDPTRPEGKTARLVVGDALERAAGRADVTTAREETVSEPGSRYIDWLIPGLIGMNLMGSGLWGLGFSVVVARTRKILKRLAATPMRRTHFLLSYMFSRLFFLVLEVGAVLGFAWLVFGVEIHGSLLALLAVTLLGSLSFAGVGLLIAARPTTIEGVSGLMNLFMLPMWLLSGTFFSSERFPEALQPFIKALPLTALNDALRGVINDGSPVAALWAPLAILVAWGLVSFVIALRIFRWQ